MTVPVRVAMWSGTVDDQTPVQLPFDDIQANDYIILFAGRLTGGWSYDSVAINGLDGYFQNRWMPSYAHWCVATPTSFPTIQAGTGNSALVVVLQYRNFSEYDGLYPNGVSVSSGGDYPPYGWVPHATNGNYGNPAPILRSIFLDRFPAEASLYWPDGDDQTSVAYLNEPSDYQTYPAVQVLDLRETMISVDSNDQPWMLQPYDQPSPGMYDAGGYWSFCVILASTYRPPPPTLKVLKPQPSDAAGAIGSGRFPIR